MDVPVNRPTASYPSNYAKGPTPSTPSTPQDTPSRKNNSTLSVPSLGSKRNQSLLSLASLNLAHSSSSLLGIFSSALDSVPTPIPTPPIEARRERTVIEELDIWAFIRDTARNISVLFALGYAFAV
jgi:hypothetical protein